ncbi:MAG: hypothetical protein O2951_10595 [Bacteroidetes bacterium]|nr:hypothetical protein [Bacteroidota bacterium]
MFLVIVNWSASGQKPDDLFKVFKFRNVGPLRGGRVTTVTGVETEASTFYMGSSGGGVWKTIDFGITWNNVSDGFFATGSIGAIRVAKTDSDIIYTGTGSDGLRSNVIVGKGVYKSMDAGKTWKHIGLKDAGQIGAIEIHPENPDVAFVAAIGQPFQANNERGVFRTRNGGLSWEKVLFHSDTVGAVDVEFSPKNPDIVYASLWRAERKPWNIISGGYQSGGIYKSVDGGDTWQKKTEGLPSGLIGKIDLAVSHADPKRLYAIIEAPEDEGGLYRSDNYGESFLQISSRKELVNRPFYYCNIDANPLNADMIVSNANPGLISRDAGLSWEKINTPHGDNHDIWINPSDTSIWIQSNDGGANVTVNSGKTWSTQYNQPTAELYQVEVDDQYPYWLYSGMQDNRSAIAVPSLPPYDVQKGSTGWLISTGGCETGPAIPKPGNHNVVFTGCKGRFGVYDKRTGQEKQYYIGATNIYGHNPRDLKFRFQRVAPLHISPHNPDVIYMGSQYVHKTTDGGLIWQIISPDLTAFEDDKQVIPGTPITRDVTGEEYYSALYSLRESVLKEGLIWAGSNDGPVHVTKDGGKSWVNVTPPLPKGGRVDCVEPSHHQEGSAYVSVLRNLIGDWKPYIFKTSDFGKNWELISNNNGIPDDYPVRVVREDPEMAGTLYAGTEFGLFISLNNGDSWYSFQQDLPVTPVTDIKLYRNNLIVSTMGRGLWIMDNVKSLKQLSQIGGAEVFLFQPADTYNYRYSYRSSEKESVPKYPNPSVLIDYYFKSVPEDPVEMNIINDQGSVICSFNSGNISITQRNEPDIIKESEEDVGRMALTKNSGINQFQWDMCHSGAWHINSQKSYINGPRAVPGQYTIKLKANGVEQVRTFQLLMNPNLDLTGLTKDDLKAQEELALQVRELLSEARKTEYSLNGSIKKFELDTTRAIDELKELIQIKSAFSTANGAYMQPMLIDQIEYLANMVYKADQRPGKDAYDRYDELSASLKGLSARIMSLEK